MCHNKSLFFFIFPPKTDTSVLPERPLLIIYVLAETEEKSSAKRAQPLKDPDWTVDSFSTWVNGQLTIGCRNT